MATVPEVRKAIAAVSDRFGLSYDDALSVCASFQGGPQIKRILKDDFSDVPGAAAALGIALKETRKIAEAVAGEVVPPSDFYGLPEDLPARIDDIVAEFCAKYHLEDISKASADQWRAVCMLIGNRIFRKSDILKDTRPGARPFGGAVPYVPERVLALIDLWGYMCGASKHAPLVVDFLAFSCISSAWLYNHNGRSPLTSAGSGILEKLQSMQESGVASRLIDGRVNPTGSIFFLKNVHGWRDQRDIVTTRAEASPAPAALPVFDVSGGGFAASLPDNSGGDGLPG